MLLRAVDNKDRWIATVAADGDAGLRPRHRLTDPAWINWTFNDGNTGAQGGGGTGP